MDLERLHLLARNSHQLASSLPYKPEFETEASPRYERQISTVDWQANLESFKTPRPTNRSIVDFERLMQMSDSQKVGANPDSNSPDSFQEPPLADRHLDTNVNMQAMSKGMQKTKSIHSLRPSESVQSQCCSLFRKNPPPVSSSKVLQPPRIQKQPNLNQLSLEKRQIKIVTSGKFNKQRRTSYCFNQKVQIQPRTNVPSQQHNTFRT